MIEISYLTSQIDSFQWFVAIAFVPLVCWHQGLVLSSFFRMFSLASGYGVQIGFFLLLDDVGFQISTLIFIASLAAYFWITSTASAWPKAKPRILQPLEAEPPVAESA